MAQQSLFKDPLFKLYETQDSLKALRSALKEIVDDEPMELEDLRLSLKGMKRRVKDCETEHLKNLAEKNTEYMDLRERIQADKEVLANAKREPYKQVNDEKKKRGADIDETVQAERHPVHNGKLLK